MKQLKKNIKNTVNLGNIFTNDTIKNLFFVPLFLGAFVWIGFTIVTSPGDTKSNEAKLEIKCAGVEKVRKAQCWADLIDHAVETKGIEAALDTLAYLHDTQSDAGFAQTCHALSHNIGERAYQMFTKNEDFVVTPKSIYCDFGFFHGFLETVLVITENIREARKFCDSIETQLSGALPDITLQCYHGIGHGIVAGHDPRIRGDARTIVKSAIGLCEDVTDSDSELENCLSGVFNGLGNYSITGEYGLAINEKDPLWICREQLEKYKPACYGLMARVLLATAGGDLTRALYSIEDAVEGQYKITTASNIAALYALQRKDEQAVSGCRGALDNTLRLPCIKGYVVGLFQSGKPEKEYEKPLEFCHSPLLLPEERTTCFSAFQSYLGTLYPSAKVQEICETVEKEYRERGACGNDSSNQGSP